MTLVVETVLRDPSGRDAAGQISTSSYETVSAVARCALDRRRAAVRSVLLAFRSEDTGVALRGLAAWYERMCVDSDYGNAPPEEGVRALMAMGDEEDKPVTRQLVLTYWAVRVAEEVASCRRRWCSKDSTPDDLQVALAKLDLALHGAFEEQQFV